MIRGDLKSAKMAGTSQQQPQRTGIRKTKTSNRTSLEGNDRLANAFRILSNHSVTRILDALRYGEMTISAIARDLAMEPITILRPILLLHREALLSSRKRAGAVFYSLASPDLIDAMDLMHKISVRQYRKKVAISIPGFGRSIHPHP